MDAPMVRAEGNGKGVGLLMSNSGKHSLVEGDVVVSRGRRRVQRPLLAHCNEDTANISVE